jgi:hypothetical protein
MYKLHNPKVLAHHFVYNRELPEFDAESETVEWYKAY